MKKIIFSIIGIIFLTGCLNSNNDESSFELEGNPSTGFEWTCVDENNIVDIDYKIEAMSKDKTQTGSPVIYKFKLKGKKEGNTTLKCTYKRSWEENDFDRVKEYLVNVDSNLKVRIEEINK